MPLTLIQKKIVGKHRGIYANIKVSSPKREKYKASKWKKKNILGLRCKYQKNLGPKCKKVKKLETNFHLIIVCLCLIVCFLGVFESILHVPSSLLSSCRFGHNPSLGCSS